MFKKICYGNIKLKRSEGFDYDDGWVPGFRSKGKEEDIEYYNSQPSLVNDNNKYLKELIEKSKETG